MNKTQHNTGEQEPKEQEPDLDAALEALQAVVMTQKAQIDALLASLEGLLTALNHPPTTGQLVQAAAQPEQAMATVHPRFETRHLPQPMPRANAELPGADAALLGNPADPQFASLHQLMGRLKAA
jgi:hypothetical protein